MAFNRYIFYRIVGILILATLTAGCEDTVDFVNTPPSDIAISRNKCAIWTGGELILNGSAKDLEEDPLTFSWSANAGSFTPPEATGEEITWNAPDSPGSAIITLRVSDGIDERSVNLVIDVGEELASPIYGNVAIDDRGFPYIITDNQPVSISASSHLTIEAGVRLIVDAEFGGLDVRGGLTVEGRADNMVDIGPNDCIGVTATWGGIYISGEAAQAVIKHMNIYSGADGVQIIEGASATIDSSNITDNDGPAISVVEGASVTIRNCKIWDNGTGLFVSNAHFSVLNSSIRYNAARGISVTVVTDAPASYTQLVEGSVVANNGFDGIYLVGEAYPEIHQCSMFFNGPETGGGYAVRLNNYWASDTIHAEQNYWGVTTEAEIAEQIYDKTDNPTNIQAFVGFIPWLDSEPLTVIGRAERDTHSRSR